MNPAATPASFRRLLGTIGVALAIIAAVSIPAGYLFVGYSSIISDLAFRADLNAASALNARSLMMLE